MEDNDKDNNNYMDITALGLDRDPGFSQGHQWHRPPDDDDEKEEDDNEVEDNNMVEDNNEVEDNNNDDNNYKDISVLGLDRDLGFLQGHQGHRPHDDDEEEEEDGDNDEVEDNNKDDNNYMEANIDKGILGMGLDRDLGFSRGCQTKPCQTKPRVSHLWD